MATTTTIEPHALTPLRQQHGAPDSVVHHARYERIAESLKRKPRVKKSSFFALSRGIKATDRMLLMDNLSTMLAAGLGITDALTILVEEMKHKRLKHALMNVRDGIEVGKSFSEGLQMYPEMFPPLQTATIRVGEVSGTLVDVLARLAEMARRENQLRRKVIGALMYPTIVLFAMIVVGIIMLTYVFPQIISVFIESNIKLPFQIVFINTVSDILRNYGFFILGGFLALCVLVYFILKIRKVRKFVHRLSLRMPLVGTQIIKGSILARITLNLRTMLMSGLPIVEGVKIISSTIGNLEYRDELGAIASEIEVGRSIHESFAARPHLFTAIVTRMVKVGEETGKLDDILQKLGTYYEEKVDDILGNLSTIIEPVLLLLMGVVVGFIAVSIIGPIYDVANSI